MTILAMIVLVLLIVLFALSFKIFICLFVYSDAKERSDNPLPWAILVFFVSDFIGLLLYFLLGRKKVVTCSFCSARMQQGSRFCPTCGREALGAREVGFSKSAKRLLIAAIASLALLLIFVAILVISSVFDSLPL